MARTTYLLGLVLLLASLAILQQLVASGRQTSIQQEKYEKELAVLREENERMRGALSKEATTGKAWTQQAMPGTLATVVPTLPPDLGESSVECKGIMGYNQTCLLRNAFFTPSKEGIRLHVLAKTADKLEKMKLQRWGGHDGGMDVGIDRFDTLEQLQDFHKGLEGATYRPGLTLHFSTSFTNNWVHALFDGLWPGFAALAQFGRHRDRFLPFVYMSDKDKATPCREEEMQKTYMFCAMEEAYRLFGAWGDRRGEILKVYEVPPSGWVVFEEVIWGSGHRGQIESVMRLPESDTFPDVPPQQSLLRLFVERLYRSHDLQPPQQRDHSYLQRAGRKLRAIVTMNKRWNSTFETMLKGAVALCSSQCKGVTLSVVDWGKLGGFRRQLKRISNTDILLTSIGTALFFSLLLPDGSVVGNLGTLQERSNLPNYGEEFLGLSHRGIGVIHLPIDQVLQGGPNARQLLSFTQQAADLITSDFVLPRPSDLNLSPLGVIMLNLTRESELSARGLGGWRKLESWESSVERWQYNLEESWACPHRIAAELVYEDCPDMGRCHIDLPKLRALKKAANLATALELPPAITEPGAPCEECIVCTACVTAQWSPPSPLG